MTTELTPDRRSSFIWLLLAVVGIVLGVIGWIEFVTP